jgi:hypothetical protein
MDRLVRAGRFHAADLDELVLPPGISRTLIGTAINDLSQSRLIRRAGPPTQTTASGRHSSFVFTWRLAADRDAVASWKRSHPVPTDPDEEQTP